ncbi:MULTISPECIES: helix-turn-helix transcriptional regulator [Halomonadaceae]|jgi:predicted DNA-binding transcriptional regulator YafY|uniref:WYL domain-containing protein n=1 Tax=Vreelandella piezotolerans TaxID=2609667 RepID=A0ABQ6X4N4_9GAMM|nr:MULTISPECIES: WYL domain-containing protein [Halomonas]KAE8436995.1 WYL domain-containing protein [Halomonas piezotolerans]MBR9902414.1 WYL domain-containing protein [Gammaproteobacteria bacterium]QJA22969.1 WYL domain-containing protein [Halomonas piezotolerans]|tara:strand:- start:1447 stop:2331 length:885 start_codon:yes stop_codon:yes gene_type:complete
MRRTPFEGVSGQQLERLAHIEFLVYFTGKVTRKDIMSRFGVSSAAATRDLGTYIDEAPVNIVYDPRQKHYVATNQFQCLLPLSAEKCLSTLTSGFGDVMESREVFRCAYSIALEKPDLDITATFSRAISLSRPVEIEYVSTSSGSSTRIICPHSLMNNGLRWHVRAYDRKRKKFSDFVINRVLSIELLYQEIFEKNESIDEDAEWMEQVELIIQPHPRLPRNKQRAVEEEFRMQGGVLLKEVKKAQVGYLLNSWNVDSTVDADLKGHHVLLHLKNAEDIKKMNIESFLLAPSLD